MISFKISISDTHKAYSKGTLIADPASSKGKLVRCHWVKSSASIMKKKVSSDVTLITDVHVGEFLKVDKTVLWVTPDIMEQLMVMSNLEWTIT